MRSAPLGHKGPGAKPHSSGGDAVLTLATNSLVGLLATASGLLAARILGPSGRGELAAIMMWPSFLGVLAMLGMQESLVYFSARERAQAGRILGSAVVVALTSAVPFMFLGYALIPWLLTAQPGRIAAAARIFLLQIPLAVIVGLSLQTLRGTGNFNLWNPMRLVLPTVWLTLLATASLTGWKDPARIAHAYLFLTAVAVLPMALTVLRRLPGSLRPDPARWVPMLRYGLPCVLTTLPMVLNLRMDQMLMAALLPARDLGLYAAAATWGGALGPLTGAVGLVLFPKVASQPVPQHAHKLLARGVRAGALLAVSAGFALLIFTPVGLPLLFGPKFAASVPSALILVVAAIFSGWNLAMSAGLRGLGFPTSALIAESCGLVVTAVALWVLLQPYGILGAAVASLVAYGTTSIVLLIQAHVRTGLSFQTLLWPKGDELHLGLIWLKDRADAILNASSGSGL